MSNPNRPVSQKTFSGSTALLLANQNIEDALDTSQWIFKRSILDRMASNFCVARLFGKVTIYQERTWSRDPTGWKTGLAAVVITDILGPSTSTESYVGQHNRIQHQTLQQRHSCLITESETTVRTSSYGRMSSSRGGPYQTFWGYENLGKIY